MYKTLKLNPKTEGSNIIACRPQTGICPIGCNQCFYNRPGAFYCDINEPYIPSPYDMVGRPRQEIVRMNDGGDSNTQKELVIETAQKYEHYFFNTSIPNFDFPGPVVFTANPKEEEPAYVPITPEEWGNPELRKNVPADAYDKRGLRTLMFVRLRVSPTNHKYIREAVWAWKKMNIPVVLTFMAYYDQTPPGTREFLDGDSPRVFVLEDLSEFGAIAYTWQKRHINSYYCATRDYMAYVVKRMKKIGGRLVTMCGDLDSRYCRDCRNCETYYRQTMKHLKEKG